MRQITLVLLLLLIVNVLLAKNTNETLNFRIRYGFIMGGKVTMKAQKAKFENKDVVYLNMHGKTVGLTGTVYNVDNTYECFVDTVSFLPLNAKYSIKEQSYKRIDEVRFHLGQKKVFSKRLGWVAVDDDMFDLVSLIYYLRFSDKLSKLKANDELTLPFWNIDEVDEVELRFTGKTTLKTKLGTFECLKIEPAFDPGASYNSKTPLSVWITDDERRLPILIQINFKFGSVKCELVSY